MPTLLEKILLEKSKKEKEPKAISKVESEQARLMGMVSATPLRRAKIGKMPNHKNILKMEKHFGFSIEELIAEYKP
jgi:hypothetical protein